MYLVYYECVEFNCYPAVLHGKTVGPDLNNKTINSEMTLRAYSKTKHKLGMKLGCKNNIVCVKLIRSESV